MKIIETNLSVSEMRSFEQFLKYHNITEIVIGIYEKPISRWQTDHLLKYAYDDTDNDTTGSLVALSLKFGSLEKAFLEVRYNGMSTDISRI